MVTLHGPGGVGKTRLALTAAAIDQATSAATASCLVELAPMTAPDLVLPTIAQALGVQPRLPGLRPSPRCNGSWPARTCCWCWTTSSTCSTQRRKCTELAAAAPGLSVLVTSRWC